MYWDSYSVIWLITCFSAKSYAYSNLKCYGGYFDYELCPGPSTIKVTSATYGLSDCHDQADTGACCPKETDCEIPVTGEYLEDIKTKCNGRQRCYSSLRALWTSAAQCRVSGMTDYVTIHYDCLQDGSTIHPSVIPSSIVPTASTIMSTVNTEVTTEHGQITSDGLGWGAISGISVGAILLLMLLIGWTGTVLIRRKRNQPNMPKTKGPTSRNRKMKSSLEDCHVATINPKQLENTSDIHGLNSIDNPSADDLQTSNIEPHNPYLSVIGDKEFLTRHPSAIPNAYLEVSCSESENPQYRVDSCHYYAEIDAPHLAVCPMPPKALDNFHMATINPQQPEKTSALQPSEVHDNHAYESLNHQTYTPLNLQLQTPTDHMQANFHNCGLKSVDNPCDGCLQPNKVEPYDSYISVIEERDFLTRHPSAIPDAYLEVPCSGLENHTESGQLDGRDVSCHSYVEIDIDKPPILPCPMPPKTSIDQVYLKTEIKPVEIRPTSSTESQYESIANEAVA